MSMVPPFTVSAQAIFMIVEIAAQMERCTLNLEQQDSLKLRRANRIRTICSSLAIEGNTLSETQVSDIIKGKPVIAPRREIQEVKNTIRAYELFPELDPFFHFRYASCSWSYDGISERLCRAFPSWWRWSV